jgi:dipeptidyl aminopeptidase/acylaminoacyl peptidase
MNISLLMDTTFRDTLLYSISLFCFLMIFSSHVHAQKANYEQAQQFTGERMEKLVGSTGVFPRWIEDQDRFWYSYETGDGKNWYMVDAKRPSKRTLFDQNGMAAKLAEIFNKPFNSKDLPLKDFEYDTHEGLFTFHVDSINFQYNIQGNDLVKQDSVKEEPEDRWKSYSPDSTYIAFAKKHNLYLMRADDPDSTEYQLTDSGERWYSFQGDEGDTTTTKRLRSSAQWFEDSKKLYIKRTDEREVGELWVINSLKKRPELETYKYSMPGEKNIGEQEVWVFKADTLSQTNGVKLDADKEEWKDESLGGAYFNDGGFFTGTGSDFLYILRRNRQWNNIDVLKANTSTGNVEVLFSEESKPYFNTRFAQLGVINNGKEYLWWSERTGWGQLYRYDSEGKLKNRITDGFYTAGEIAKIDTARQTIYFEGYGREEGVNPYYSMLYKIKFDGSDRERLTQEEATHQVFESDKGNFFVDNISRVDMPDRSVLRDGNGRIIQELEQTDMEALNEIGWQPPEMFKVKAADGATDLHGVMWKPFDFDSTKSYPIISYVYPGPQTEPFPIGFSLSGRNTSLAQLGFVVVAMGQRGGSPIRSKYYHNFGYGNLRDYPLIDNKYGIEQLAARHSFIDQDRVGIFGHSGGGFMSTAALLTYPDFYDVAVSSSGNHDNNIYNIYWSEVHNGVEKSAKTIKVDDGDGSKKDSTITTFKAPIETNIDLAENLKGHLLLVTGDIDNNVHPANTYRMANALMKAGKRFDFMIMPGQRHGYGNYTPYFERMLWDYFSEHLLGYKPDKVNYNIPDYDE